jgi:hypothetical protein
LVKRLWIAVVALEELHTIQEGVRYSVVTPLCRGVVRVTGAPRILSGRYAHCCRACKRGLWDLGGLIDVSNFSTPYVVNTIR